MSNGNADRSFDLESLRKELFGLRFTEGISAAVAVDQTRVQCLCFFQSAFKRIDVFLNRRSLGEYLRNVLQLPLAQRVLKPGSILCSRENGLDSVVPALFDLGEGRVPSLIHSPQMAKKKKLQEICTPTTFVGLP